MRALGYLIVVSAVIMVVGNPFVFVDVPTCLHETHHHTDSLCCI